MIKAGLFLNISLIFSLFFLIVGIFVIHRYAKSLVTWRVRSSLTAGRWNYGNLGEDEPILPTNEETEGVGATGYRYNYSTNSETYADEEQYEANIPQKKTVKGYSSTGKRDV
eukprot:c21549_g1_i2.p1 GENE.c21549_g1_i2~~c21549_g1_i2.p1  ORF type:complete len:112 (-),score=30.18 c21549_g1_i2:142-477(-)